MIEGLRIAVIYACTLAVLMSLGVMAAMVAAEFGAGLDWLIGLDMVAAAVFTVAMVRADKA